MTKHTPGPWRVEQKVVRAHVFAEHIGMDCHVATCFGPNPASPDDIEAIALANARLIAAAPDLLAALEDAALALEETGGRWAVAAAGRARAAIAKAKGE